MKQLFKYLLGAILSLMLTPLQAQEIQEDFLMLKLDEGQINELVDKALQHSYVLKALYAEARQKNEKVRQNRLGFLQNFDVGVQLFDFNRDLSEQTYVGGAVSNAGLSLRVNLFGIATYRNQIRYAKEDVRRTESDILRQRQILRNWIEGKYLDYMTLLEVIQARQALLTNMEQQLTLTQKRFQKGEAKTESYLDALNGVTQMREGLIRVKMEARKIYRELMIFTTPEEDEAIRYLKP